MSYWGYNLFVEKNHGSKQWQKTEYQVVALASTVRSTWVWGAGRVLKYSSHKVEFHLCNYLGCMTLGESISQTSIFWDVGLTTHNRTKCYWATTRCQAVLCTFCVWTHWFFTVTQEGRCNSYSVLQLIKLRHKEYLAHKKSASQKAKEQYVQEQALGGQSMSLIWGSVKTYREVLAWWIQSKESPNVSPLLSLPGHFLPTSSSCELPIHMSHALHGGSPSTYWHADSLPQNWRWQVYSSNIPEHPWI